MNNALKNAVDELLDICDTYSNTTVDSKTTTYERNLLITEIINFLSYLSSSDGIISKYETDFIADYIGSRMTEEELRQYVDKRNTYSSEFEQTVPQTLRRLVENEKNENIINSNAKAYVEVFKALGKEFIVCDGDANENEVADLSTYSRLLDGYLNQEMVAPNTLKSSIDLSEIHAGENIPKFDVNGERELTIQELMEQLNNLVGLDVVKKDVTSLIHLQEIRRLRKQRGLKDIPLSNHLVFYGNPGTGKTTVARLLAKIYHALGILSGGQLVEVDRSGLVAGYVGQTALKTQDVIKSALGGVLFIDEAYELVSNENQNDYGQEAVDTLLKAMEDNRENFVVIVAGYPELMARFIDSNPGLRSRFNKYINFEDYSTSELIEIFKIMCKNSGYTYTNEAIETVSSIFQTKYKNRGKNFANAREVRNFFEASMLRQADRLFEIQNPSNVELTTLTDDDVRL